MLNRYTPGSKMVQSDALSRWPVLCPDEDKDNEDMIMLPDNMFLSLINVDLHEKIAMSNDLDGNVAEALKLLLEKAPTPTTVGLEDWTIEQTNRRNILFYKGKNYIPRNTELWRDIVKNFHDHETAEHPGEIGTYNDNITGGQDFKLL